MNREPQQVYAQLGGDPTRLHRGFRRLPVILVPGIMASRLSDAEGKPVWNPLAAPLGDSPGLFAADYERLRQVSAPLFPDEVNRYDDEAKNKKKEHIKHFFNVIVDKYDPLLEALGDADTTRLDPYGLRLSVYCCGYDWRQDNARSALRLAEVVDEALRDTGASKVILIGHSMGCTVCRYYCRVLGGESVVHRLILLGSPTLGSPGAYNTLKIGPPGAYVKDIKKAIHEGDEQGAVFELLRGGGNAVQQMANVGTTGWGAAQSMPGDIYLGLCLGAGKWLTRDETTHFARQVPALYQLVPTTVFCRKHPNWLIFDPLATGYLPTGFMVVLPTLFQAAVEAIAATADALAGASEKEGDKIREGAEKAFDPDREKRTSSRTKRNAMTVAELFETLSFDDLSLTAQLLKNLYERLEKRMFLDCRNNDLLYRDIYTGVLDRVDTRAISAGNLLIAQQFEKALTVDHRFEGHLTPLGLVGKLLNPALSLPPVQAVVSSIAGFFSIDEEEDEAPKKEDRGPRAYIPPRTVNVCSVDLAVEGGGILFPTAVISFDDSNVVRQELLPNLVVTVLGIAGADDIFEQAFGDGTVPKTSVNPPEELLCRPFLDVIAISKALHAEMCQHAEVVEAVMDTIFDSLDDYVNGTSAQPYVAPSPGAESAAGDDGGAEGGGS
ncbi:MAG: alpha/beta fold hydrolase [Myxococcota bacterium]